MEIPTYDWTPFLFLNNAPTMSTFRHVIRATNSTLDGFISSKASVWDCIPALAKAHFIRALLIGHLFEAYKDHGEVVPLTRNNISYLQYPNGSQYHMIQICRIDDPNIPPEESETLKDARLHQDKHPSMQLPLEGFTDSLDVSLEDEEKPPIAFSSMDLTIYASYKCENDRIAALYFQKIDRVRGTVLNYVELDLALPTSIEGRTSAPIRRSSRSVSVKTVESNEQEDTA